MHVLCFIGSSLDIIKNYEAIITYETLKDLKNAFSKNGVKQIFEMGSHLFSVEPT